MIKDKICQEIHSFLYNQGITQRTAISVKIENIISVAGVHGKSWEKEDLKTVIEHIGRYGTNIISVPSDDILKIAGVNKKEIQSYHRCTEQYQLESQIDSFFGKKQIGSLNRLFLENKPKTIKKWINIVDDRCGEKIKKEAVRASKSVIKYIEYAMDSSLTKKQKDNCIKRIEYSAQLLSKEKSFNGFVLQYAVILYLSKKLKLPYAFEDDKMDSVGIDGSIGGIKVSIKPTSYTGSSCRQYYKNPTIYYELTKGNVIINCDELIVMINKNKGKL